MVNQYFAIIQLSEKNVRQEIIVYTWYEKGLMLGTHRYGRGRNGYHVIGDLVFLVAFFSNHAGEFVAKNIYPYKSKGTPLSSVIAVLGTIVLWL